MCKENKIKVVLCKPDMQAIPYEIDNDLRSLQQTVGGEIECIYPFEDEVALICNSEGKINGLPLNRGLRSDNGELYDIIAGTFFITELTEDDFGSLSPKLMEKYLAVFKYPETFVKVNGRIIGMREEG